MWKKSKEDLRRLMELRRSNAASPKLNKKKYTRQSNKKMLELEKKGKL
jgi:hypothetical protein